jgi:DNA polymerase-3 subunit gamma/tau
MSYLSLYRKYRPQRFEDVIGQEPVVRTLRNALQRGRVAHAYMFSGPRGTGKTSLARLLAKGLNCLQGPTAEPCNACSNCQRISDGFAMDVVEIDGASNRGIDEIRDLRENVRFAPTEGGYKVYIIDEVHMLTTDAFNALLKTLEEPPERVVFVLATTEPHKVPETIASRCQRFEFRNFTTEQLITRLEQVVEAEQLDVASAALSLIGRHAAGGMRDALALLDQVVSFQSGRIEEIHVAELLGVVPEEQLCQLLDHIAGHKRPAAITLIHQMIGNGADPAQLGKDCISLLRELMLARVGKSEDSGIMEESWAARWPDLVALELEEILTLIDLLARAVADMRWMSPVWLPLEMAVVRSTEAGSKKNTQPGDLHGNLIRERELVERLQHLEAIVKELQASSNQPALVGSEEAETGETIETKAKPAADHFRKTDTVGMSVTPSTGGSGEGEFGLLLSRWGEVSEALRQERQAPVEAFLREATPRGLDEEGRILLAFSRAKEFHKASLEQPKNKEVLERILAPIVGRAVEVVCCFEDEIPSILRESDSMGTAHQQEGAISETSRTENPALKAALKIFGGTVVKVKDDSGEGSGYQ